MAERGFPLANDSHSIRRVVNHGRSSRQEIVGPVDAPSAERPGRSIQLQAVTTLATAPAATAASSSFESFFAEIVWTVVREELAAMAPPAEPTKQPAAEYLTIARAADVASVHPCTVRAWIKDGSLHAYRCGGRGYRILRSDLDARLTVAEADPTNEQIRGRVDAILAKQRAKRRAA